MYNPNKSTQVLSLSGKNGDIYTQAFRLFSIKMQWKGWVIITS